MSARRLRRADLLRAGTLVVAFAALFARELRRPLRAPVQPKLRRTARNLTIAAAGAATLGAIESPLVTRAARRVEQRRLGLLQRRRLPRWLEALAAFALMDYTLYHWHVLTHRVPLLWRFHAVHHADLDLDASTALRFHFGELALSVPYRLLQVRVLGVGPRALSIWQFATLLSVLFHHSNVALPPALERVLSRLVVTPPMHGIHHSVVDAERNSNFSSGLSVWDVLHGTLRRDVPQAAIRIGLCEPREPRRLALRPMLAYPFGAGRRTGGPAGR